MKIKTLIEKQSVTYFSDLRCSQGKVTRVIVLQARFETRNDLPRLYKLAKERADEIKLLMHQEQNQFSKAA